MLREVLTASCLVRGPHWDQIPFRWPMKAVKRAVAQKAGVRPRPIVQTVRERLERALDLLGHLRRLSDRGRHWLRERAGPIAWFTVFNGGIAVAVDPDVSPEEVALSARINGGPRQALPIAQVTRLADQTVLLATLDAELFRAPGTCSVHIGIRGRTRQQRFATGPGRYAGRIDGVRDYAVEGWVSPLFAEAEPTVQLLVDGRLCATAPLDRFRPEMMLGGGAGGWNGFRLLMPPQALDGKPHRIAVNAGETALDFGTWTARPKFHIEAAGGRTLSGWYFDRSADDIPATLRIVTHGRTQARTKTHGRPDIKAAFGRDWASFSFDETVVEAGSTLVAGPEGTGFIVGRIGSDRLERIAACRRQARDLLVDGSRLGATLAQRDALRTQIRKVERHAPATRIAFKPASAEPAPVVSASAAKSRSVPPVCAIVPVYNGLADLKLCLDSLIPQLQPGRVRAVAIDDGSPDPTVAAYLAGLDHPGLTVLANPRNLGFIATVNRGFALLETGEDALLINADTILPPGAIERLAQHCHAWPGIASVTPMSNTATILSFPSLTRANRPPLGLDVAELDRAFQANGAAPEEILTGVGYCMHINRAALDEVGLLSANWGRGYCEEVDWCLSARDLGWIHIAATDTFVMHEGSVSFTNTTRLELLATNHAQLEALYPEYVEELNAFTRADPLERVRSTVLQRLLAGRFGRLTLHLMHGLGGGTLRYSDDLRALAREADHEIAILAPVKDGDEGGRLELAFDRAGLSLTLRPDRVESMLAGLEAAGVTVMLHVNSRLTYRSTFLERLLNGRRPYVVMLHDFQWYCPRVHLTDGRGFYCGEPPKQVCQLCVGGGVAYNFADQADLIESDLESFLVFNQRLLAGAERLLAPSRDTADRYATRFGLDDIVVLPHPEPLPQETAVGLRRPDPDGPLRIAVVGAIGPHKGYDLLLRMAEHAARDRIPFFATVIGYTCGTPSLVRYGNVAVTGSYAVGELQDRLAAADPDFVFLPSVWPETYSYVLSEIWEAGYPVVAFDFGAPAERIRAEGGGILIPPTRDTHALLASLRALRAGAISDALPRRVPARVPSLDEYYSAAGIGRDGRRLVDRTTG